MYAAITDGLLKNVSPSDVPGQCPTGNCTFEAYQSMGVCSEVVDVSSSITSRCTTEASQNNPAGCNYSVPAINEEPTATETSLTVSEYDRPTLWVGASDPFVYNFPEIYTLAQFYVIYVPDLDKWATYDLTEDHKEEMVVFKATLNLCLYTYNTTMTFGVTKTDQVSKITNLDWQEGTEHVETTPFPTVTTRHGNETFWMSQLNIQSFNQHLALETFTGTATFKPKGPDGYGNLTQNDAVRAIAYSIYYQPSASQGLSDLMDRFAVSLTNGCAFTHDLAHKHIPDIQAGYAPLMIYLLQPPGRLVPSRCTSRYSGLGCSFLLPPYCYL